MGGATEEGAAAMAGVATGAAMAKAMGVATGEGQEGAMAVPPVAGAAMVPQRMGGPPVMGLAMGAVAMGVMVAPARGMGGRQGEGTGAPVMPPVGMDMAAGTALRMCTAHLRGMAGMGLLREEPARTGVGMGPEAAPGMAAVATAAAVEA